jgi:hypothetical protein
MLVITWAALQGLAPREEGRERASELSAGWCPGWTGPLLLGYEYADTGAQSCLQGLWPPPPRR